MSLSETDALLAEANRCVACGLCVPRCPTYRQTLLESDSPRGRVMLMKGVLEGRLPLNARFVQHIELCLTCRACERACPSRVAFGSLVDGVRERIEQTLRPRRPWSVRLLKRFVASPARLALLSRGARVLSGSRLGRRVGLPGNRDAWGRGARMPTRANYPARGPERGRVSLFLGCVARAWDAETLSASVFVLNRLGYTVVVPPGQVCCGALHQHTGELAQAHALAQKNRSVFADAGLPVLSTASGCGATLSEYEGKGAAGAFSHMDIHAFLDRSEGWEGIERAPLSATIAVHEPCTLRNVLRGESHVYGLLGRVPGARIVPLEGNDQCCGAAGTYFLTEPAMAGRLRDDKIEAIAKSGAQYVVTANVGCRVWLAHGLAARGLDLPVVHPVTLIAQTLGFKGRC
ncbi:MAG: heterodisulfide reductase-related iron-sulfur binding cluster [Betaproteobacteria bacterium]|nr:heterodisulfide reductase-related iron-sulfur binding cluster [Betaproteobacteria bacterium]